MAGGLSDAAVRALLASAEVDVRALGVDEGELVKALARHEDLAALHVADLAFAFACGKGSRAALEAFEKKYRGEIVGALSRLRVDAATVDEVAQRVREKIFVAGPDDAPRIATYAGRGTLTSWLRAVVVRTALDHGRREALEPAPAASDEPLLFAAGPSADPVLEALRARYAEPFREAFREAVRALPKDERNVLRLHAVEGLNIDRIGELYGVHRATVARWIAGARAQLVDMTRERLLARAPITPQEFDSIARACLSILDLGRSELFTGPSPSSRDRRR